MKNLILNPTGITPNVNMDFASGKFEISGVSLPEDPYHFYKPLIDWLNSYSKNPAQETEVIFKMEYFNTSSTVFILKLIKGIARIKETGKKTNIKWYYKQGDEDMNEAGRDFGALGQVPVELIAYS